MKTKFKSAKTQKGFSLVEVLLAVVILGFIVVLLTNLPNSVGLITRGKQSAVAKDIASQIIEDARSAGYDNLADGTSSVADARLSSLSGGAASRQVSDCPLSICKNNEEIKQVVASIDWQEDGTAQNIKITTFISKGGLR